MHGHGLGYSKMKHLKLLVEEGEHGFFSVDRKIAVNLNSLNSISKNEEQLIDYICRIWHHEYLHYAIHKTLWDMYGDREEEIVEDLSDTFEISTADTKQLYWTYEVE